MAFENFKPNYQFNLDKWVTEIQQAIHYKGYLDNNSPQEKRKKGR